MISQVQLEIRDEMLALVTDFASIFRITDANAQRSGEQAKFELSRQPKT
jgi:hypothetical protein